MKQMIRMIAALGAIFLLVLSAGCEWGSTTTEYTLTVSISGNGSVSPSGGTYDEGTTVTLTASPASGWVFAGWSGAAGGTSSTVQVTMDSNKTVVATFTATSTGDTDIDFQAESAGLYSAVVESEHSGYSGSGYVNFENETGSSMSFIVNALSSGNADLTFRFANGSSASRPMDIDVDGSTQVYDKSFGATGAWTSWNETTATVYLDRGENEIVVVSTGSEGGPNMDMVTVSGNISSVTAGTVVGDDDDDDDDDTPINATGLVGFASMGSGTTGGAGGTTVTVSNASNFLNYAQSSGSYIIQVSGTISLSGMNKVASNKTIIGLGSSAKISGGGLNLSGVSNIIIRNITFTGADDDSINIQEKSNHIWIDHCDFTNGYDGLVDIKRQSSYITVSWNHFYNHRKTCLLGHSDSNTEDVGYLKVTYHHNWFDNTYSRHPRVRFGHVHVFNNYYVGNDYGVASTMAAEVLVEGNYFSGVKSPTLVGYADSDVGDLVQRNNVFNNCTNSPQTRGSVPSFSYSYSLDSASSIPSIVSSGAGVGKL